MKKASSSFIATIQLELPAKKNFTIIKTIKCSGNMDNLLRHLGSIFPEVLDIVLQTVT